MKKPWTRGPKRSHGPVLKREYALAEVHPRDARAAQEEYHYLVTEWQESYSVVDDYMGEHEPSKGMVFKVVTRNLREAPPERGRKLLWTRF